MLERLVTRAAEGSAACEVVMAVFSGKGPPAQSGGGGWDMEGQMWASSRGRAKGNKGWTRCPERRGKCPHFRRRECESLQGYPGQGPTPLTSSLLRRPLQQELQKVFTWQIFVNCLKSI